MKPFALSRRQRIRKQREFDRVYANDAFAADAVLVLKACRNGRETSRLGLSVSRRVGNAVVRNRWKRCLREAFRQTRSQLPGGLDIVARPRQGAACDFPAICRSFPQLARQLDRRLPPEAENE